MWTIGLTVKIKPYFQISVSDFQTGALRLGLAWNSQTPVLDSFFGILISL